MNDADKAYLADNTSVGGLVRWFNAECVCAARADGVAERARIFAGHANRIEDAWNFYREQMCPMTPPPARPAAVPAPSPDVVCSGCGWVNVSLLNLGEPGAPRMMCQSCCKKAVDQQQGNVAVFAEHLLAMAKAVTHQDTWLCAHEVGGHLDFTCRHCGSTQGVDVPGGSITEEVHSATCLVTTARHLAKLHSKTNG